MATKLERNCITPVGCLHFVQVFEPKAFKNNEPKYSIVVAFDKSTDLKTRHKTPSGKEMLNLREAAFNAAIEKWGPKEKWPKKLRMPFRDGDEDKPGVQGFANTIFITASSKNRPGVVDAQRRPIAKEDGTLYSGCFGRASLQAFAYDTAGNMGVSFSLTNVMKVRDGEPMTGRKSAQDDFDGFADSEDESADSEDSYSQDDDSDY